MGGAPPVEAGSGVRCSGRSSDHGQRFTRTEEGTVQQRSRALNLTGTFLCGFPGKGHVHIGGGGVRKRSLRPLPFPSLGGGTGEGAIGRPACLGPVAIHGWANCAVQARAVDMASASLVFQCRATASSSGSSGLGALISAWMLRVGGWRRRGQVRGWTRRPSRRGRLPASSEAWQAGQALVPCPGEGLGTLDLDVKPPHQNTSHSHERA